MSTVLLETMYSTYEIDEEKKLVRRVKGENQPTPRQKGDGEWQPYHHLSWLKTTNSGYCMIIHWNDAGKCTVTSNLSPTSPLYAEAEFACRK